MGSTRNLNFDLARTLLAFEVLIAHFQTHFHFKEMVLISPVPMFLAMSGYLVLASYTRSTSWLQFVWKRLLRILPPLICSFFLVWALFGLPELRNSVIYYLTCGLGPTTVNGPLWSLGTEEILYAALILLFVAGAYKNKTLIWVLTAISFVLAIGLARYCTNPVVLRYNFLPLTFLCGNLAYLYRDRLSAKVAYPLIGFSVGATLVLPMLHLPSSWAMVPASVGLIAFGTKVPSVLRKFPVEISYGLYIYHMPVLLFLSKFYMPPVLLVTLTTVGASALAILSNLYIEAPLLKLKDLEFGIRRTRQPAINVTVQPA
jgi:peptidoglycan/LPS O-acetylase OafA/YrhL